MTTPRALPFCHAKKVTDTLRPEERADAHIGTKRSISTPHEFAKNQGEHCNVHEFPVKLCAPISPG